MQGELEVAKSINDEFDPDELNNVEQNYVSFYQLLIKYLDPDVDLTEADSASLQGLAYKCPGEEGACIYQARALYEIMARQHLYYLNECEQAEGRAANNNTEKKVGIGRNKWNVQMFPNPTSSKISLLSANENEILDREIKDLSGRLVLKRRLKTNGFFTNLDLDRFKRGLSCHNQ